MRIWFESCSNYLRDEEHVQCGVISYRHKRKEWKGWTVSVFFLNGGFSLNYVDNFAEYTRIMDRRYSSVRRKK